MNKKLLIHPGEILREDFINPLNITPYALAKAIKVTPMRISEILNGKRAVTADTALRFGKFFSTSPQFWMNLQTRYELDEASSDPVYEEIVAIDSAIAA